MSAGLIALLALLGLALAASIALGVRTIPFAEVVAGLFNPDLTSEDHLIVRSLRLPRTMLGLEVGVALGLSGAAMQGLTRNPLADPSILGISSGSSLAVIIAFLYFGVTSVLVGVWFAFAGAALGSVLVYGIGSVGREGVTPVKLALAGVAVAAMLSSLTSLFLLGNTSAIGFYAQTWLIGSLGARDATVVVQALPFVVVGSLMALSSGRLLDALSLGDEVAKSLGQRVALARAFSAIAIVVLAGVAVAAAGPILFVGLMVPHVARVLTGPSYLWILPYSAVLGALLVVVADTVGRIIAPPAEVVVGTMTVLIGAPFFVWLVRRRKLAEI